jgi:hypothetical protein
VQAEVILDEAERLFCTPAIPTADAVLQPVAGAGIVRPY